MPSQCHDFRSGWAIKYACLIVFSWVLICAAAYSQDAPEAEEPAAVVVFGFESDAASGYVWHGLHCSDGMVVQNSLWLTAGPATLSLWSNYEPGAPAPIPDLNEYDISLSAAFAWHNLSLEPSILAYFYPNQSDIPTTAEASLRIAYSLGRFEPYLAHTVDLKAYKGAHFVAAGVAFAWSPSEVLEIDLAGEMGWGSARFNAAYLGVDKRALQLFSIESGLTYYPAGSLYIRPHLGLSSLRDSDLKEQVDDPLLVQAGFALGVEL
jgi:hypothetical protein